MNQDWDPLSTNWAALVINFEIIAMLFKVQKADKINIKVICVASDGILM